MGKKRKSYIKFFNDKPVYHVEGSAYGGLRMDIDKYYELDENKEELKKLNKIFKKFFKKKSNQEENQESPSIT